MSFGSGFEYFDLLPGMDDLEGLDRDPIDLNNTLDEEIALPFPL